MKHALTLSLLLWMWGAGAAAQQVELNRFRPAPLATDGMAVRGTSVPEHLHHGFQLYGDYAHKPLVYVLNTSGEYAVVENHLAVHLNASLGLFDRLAIFAGVPINAWMAGEDPPASELAATIPAPDGTGLGDVYVGARLRLFGDEGPFSMAVEGLLTIPTATVDNDQGYAGEANFAGQGTLLAQLAVGPVDIRLNIGGRVREDQRYPTLTVSDELTYALGVGVRLNPVVLVAEAHGATFVDDFFGGQQTPFESLLGLKYGHDSGITVGAGAGPGLQKGFGTPSFRALLSVAFTHAPPGDTDGDGFKDRDDLCPEHPEDVDGHEDTDGCPDPDNDGDGIPDAKDRCVNNAEDEDGHEDDDGCPDPDNDGDGILDADDKCPAQPEDTDGFEDEDGCPEPDNDKDGWPDAEDKCPAQPEDMDGFQDGDGCPEPDNDQDGVLDADDQCPQAPGKPEDNGCPVAVRIDTEKGQIIILQRVEFETAKDVILESSEGVLEEVRATLAANEQIRLLRVEGHTDSQGRDRRNQRLSEKRAASVVRWLVEHGIDAQRLSPFGCGESIPIDSNRTRAGRQANRRVEFYLIDADGMVATARPDSCKPAE